ncbi:MAG: hypothetical protein ACYCYI_07195 [Saccharofermentanales bacterium]
MADDEVMKNTGKGDVDESITAFGFDFAGTYQFPGHNGDTIDFAWAGDDNLYITHCDASGFGPVMGNFGIDMLSGEIKGEWPAYDFSGMSGRAVNPMHDENYPEWDYGAPGEAGWWKTTSITCIDDVLYLFVSPNGGDETMRQTAGRVSLIKSADHGVTWSKKASLTESMFPDMYFGAPSFIKYGRNGISDVHDGDRYVYAISNNGFMSNGDFMTLGRVEKTKIGDLDAGDWQFFTGSPGIPQPAESDWTYDVKSPEITKIIDDPGNLGQCDVVYIAPLGRYVMITWGWLFDDGSFRDPESKTWESHCTPHFNRSFTTFWQLFESPSPWGAWSKVGSAVYSNDPYAYYNPHIMYNFIKTDKNNPNAVHTFVGVAGEWEGDCKLPNDINRYNLNIIPLTLYKGNVISAKTPVSSFGRWEAGKHAGSSVASRTSGDYLDFELIADKAGKYRISTHAFNSHSYVRPLEIYVNDTLADTLVEDAGAGWSLLIATVVLKKGYNRIRIVSIGTYTEIDRITWEFDSTLPDNGIFSGRSIFDIDLENAGYYKLDLNFNNHSGQAVTKRIMVNGRIIGNRKVAAGDGLVTISLDAILRSGRNIINISNSDMKAFLDSVAWKPSSVSGNINSYRFFDSSFGNEVVREYKIWIRIQGLYSLNINALSDGGIADDYPRDLYVNDIFIGKCEVSRNISPETKNGQGCRVMLIKGDNTIKIKCKGAKIDFDSLSWNFLPIFRDFGAANADSTVKSEGDWSKGREDGTLLSVENDAFAEYDMNVNTEGLYNIYIITFNGKNHKYPQEIYIDGKLVSSEITNNGSLATRISINEYLRTGNNVLRIRCTGPAAENKMIFWSLSSQPLLLG